MGRRDVARPIGYVHRSSSSPAIGVFDTALRAEGRTSAGGSLDLDAWRWQPGPLERLLPGRSGRARLFQGSPRPEAASPRCPRPGPRSRPHSRWDEPTCNLDMLPQLVAMEARRQPGQKEETSFQEGCASICPINSHISFRTAGSLTHTPLS